MSLQTTEALVASSNVYTWEPPNRVIAARYGLAEADILRFDTNTSPAVLSYLPEALAGPFDPPLHEYPDSTYAEFAEAAAAYVDARPDEILVGCGADEVLDIIAKTFLGPGVGSVVPVPTYSMYAVLTQQRGARLLSIARRGPETGYVLDLDAMIEALPGAGVVWLCAPNNPTGTWYSGAAFEAFIKGVPADVLVVVDEAYAEFVDAPDYASALPLLAKHPNLIVTRTFSKAHALAGLRVGYALAHPDCIAVMERVRESFNVNAPGLAAAQAALADVAHLAASLDANRVQRRALADALRARGLAVSPSQTNFLLVEFGDGTARIETALLARGVILRPMGGYGLGDCLRITVGTENDNARLLAALDEVLA